MKKLLPLILCGFLATSSFSQVNQNDPGLVKKGLKQLDNNLPYASKLNFNPTSPKPLSLDFLNQRVNSMDLINDPKSLIGVPGDLYLQPDANSIKYSRRRMADVFHSKVFKIALFAALAVSFKFHTPITGY